MGCWIPRNPNHATTGDKKVAITFDIDVIPRCQDWYVAVYSGYQVVSEPQFEGICCSAQEWNDDIDRHVTGNTWTGDMVHQLVAIA